MQDAQAADQMQLEIRLAAASGRVVVPLTLAAWRNEVSAPAFFCVHSVTGAGVSDFLELAQEIGPDVAVFAIQAPRRLMANSDGPHLLDRLAENYASAIASAQPEGPIHLGGWSAGALIALETAQRLKTRGREVGLLVSIDGAPKNQRAAGNPVRYALEVLWNLPSALPHDDWRRLRRQFLLKIAARFKMKSGREADAHHPIEEVLSNFAAYPRLQQSFMMRLYEAIEGATFSPYEGPVVVYQASIKPILLSRVWEFWRGVAHSCEAVVVPGTHQTMIREPGVRLLADDLRRRLGAGACGTSALRAA